AAEPVPALKFRLLVPPVDQVHANAATFYYKALINDPDFIARWNADEQVQTWLDTPLAELPLAEIKARIGPIETNEFNAALRAGAAADYCQWEDPIRQFGANTLLSQAQKLRSLAKALVIITRYQIAEHRHTDAIETLRLCFSLSRHLGHAQSIPQSLIGMAIDDIALSATRELITEPGSPNLYWALTELASQPIEVRGAMSFESHVWEFTFHKLVDLEQRALTPAEALEIAANVQGFLKDSTAPLTADEELALLSAARAVEPAARAFLVEHGCTAAQIDAMPVLQRSLLYRWRQFQEIRDRCFRWTLLPEEEALEQRDRLQTETSSLAGSDAGSPFTEMLPSAFGCLGARLRRQRETELLRAVEALRMHAAQHGAWPKALADVKAVPVPLDPGTRQSFEYKVSGRVATLAARTEAYFVGNTRLLGERCELTLREPAAGK
ncbi:MAG TPA: hypothetical protein VMF30_11990, partial [Pirellulales bacterium]|nr:hypothetical protein [Pirellulales bacterium]